MRITKQQSDNIRKAWEALGPNEPVGHVVRIRGNGRVDLELTPKALELACQAEPEITVEAVLRWFGSRQSPFDATTDIADYIAQTHGSTISGESQDA